MAFNTKAKDMSFMVKAKTNWDLCFPDVKAKAKAMFPQVLFKDFCRLNVSSFITLFYVGLKYTISTLPYYVVRKI